jgi:hypothetical protein
VRLSDGAGSGSDSILLSSDTAHFDAPFGQEFIARFIAQGILAALGVPIGI